MKRGLRKLGVVLLVLSTLASGCLFAGRIDERDPEDLLRAAVDATFALTRVRLVEETAFPSSANLLSTREARALGTGVWTRVVEFEAPDKAHYVSSSEDSGLEAYRVGSTLAYRLTRLDGQAPEDGQAGGWVRVADVRAVEDEGVRSELTWVLGLAGVEGLLDGGLRDAGNARKVGEDEIDGVRYIVLGLEVPEWFRRFEGSLRENAVTGTPVRYEVKVWIAARGQPLLHRIEDMYVHKAHGSGLYEYVIGTRVLEPASDLEIEIPAADRNLAGPVALGSR